MSQELSRRSYGLRRVVEDSTKYRLCLLCAEKEPLECHRTLLVSRHLVQMGLEIRHIIADGELESHDSAIERLLEQLKLPSHDLFRTHQEVIKDAYRAQERTIAHVNESDASSVVF